MIRYSELQYVVTVVTD